MPVNDPFFVFGPQKCGSSLLAALLDQHPGIGLATDTVILNVFMGWLINHKGSDIRFHPAQDRPEKYFIGQELREDLFQAEAAYNEVKWFLSQLLQRYFSTSVERLNNLLEVQGESADVEFLSAEEMLPYEHGLRLDPMPLLQMAKEGCAWTDIFSAIVRQLAHTRGKDRIHIHGEKTPGHMRFVNYLVPSFRDGCFVFMIRDPLANIASYYKRNNVGMAIGKRGDINQAIDVYRGFMEPFLAFYRAHRERFLVLRFEDLLRDPQSSMDSVFAHLGVDSVPVRQQLSSRKGVYVGDRIDRERAASAFSVLSDAEQKLVMRSLAHMFDEFYPEARDLCRTIA